jgi:hypothetical protein
LTGTAQPPLPRHEFLPAHPLSPLAHPPCPLHAFIALHEWRSAVAHPPRPLHEFLAAHPLSPDLQPPRPLQEFSPLHAVLVARRDGGGLARADSRNSRQPLPAISPLTAKVDQRCSAAVRFLHGVPSLGSAGRERRAALCRIAAAVRVR